jgi:hypothetical protein
MYDFIYENIVEKGLEEVWETEKMLDKEGNQVTNKEDMYGRPTKYNLTHPEKLIFVDEVGDNTSQANDEKRQDQNTSPEKDGEHSSKTPSLTVTTPLLDSLPPRENRACALLSLLLID